MKSHLLISGAAALCFAAPAIAQNPTADVVFINDRPIQMGMEQDQLIRLVDIDNNNSYQDANELVELYNEAVPAFIRNVAFRVEGGATVGYWTNTKPNDVLFRGADTDSSGTLDQVTPFYTFTGFGLSGTSSTQGPKGVAVGPNGAVYANLDFPGGDLLRFVDLNGDGDAEDAGEAENWISNASFGSYTVPGLTGPVSVGTQNILRLAPYGNDGVLLYTTGFGASKDEAVYSARDLNGNGSVLDAGELQLFFNGSGGIADLPKNPDFFNGTFPVLEIANGTTPSQPFYARLDLLATSVEGGIETYYFASTSSNTGTFAFNINGQGVNGLIFRAQDLNLDGDVNDGGEVTMFYDGSSTGLMSDKMDKVLGIGFEDDSLYVTYLFGNAVVVGRLTDLNSDGNAMGANEFQPFLWDANNYGIVDPFVGGLPFVNTATALPRNSFANYTITGTGCSPWGNVPVATGTGIPRLGTSDFVAQVTNTKVARPAVLLLGVNTTSWFGFPLPLDLSLFGLPGCNLYQDLQITLSAFTVSAGPDPELDGVASIPLALPTLPSLVGFKIPMQWGVIDVTPFTAVIALTHLLEVEIDN